MYTNMRKLLFSSIFIERFLIWTAAFEETKGFLFKKFFYINFRIRIFFFYFIYKIIPLFAFLQINTPKKPFFFKKLRKKFRKIKKYLKVIEYVCTETPLGGYIYKSILAEKQLEE